MQFMKIYEKQLDSEFRENNEILGGDDNLE